jgi:ketosteroid isomerase-like protein
MRAGLLLGVVVTTLGMTGVELVQTQGPATARIAMEAAPSAARSAAEAAPQASTPTARAAELLAADSRLGREAAALPMRDALAAMLAPDAIMPAPGLGFAEGRDAILAALARDTLNATSRLRWSPVRAGVSGDGSHGVTIGLLTVTRADASTREFKYLAYWVRSADGWQAKVWRRIPRAAGAPRSETESPWLPLAADAGAPRLSAAALEDARRGLVAMEKIFSDSAARIGIGPAFEALGSREAMHLGSPSDVDFNRGNAVIARAVQGGAPAGSSPVTWSADWALIAPSGDLGVTLGYIVPNGQPAGAAPQRFPFFTIWRREAGGWKYIAE